ncbi:uncharacterized protein LOC112000669 [Quercus suber]|uniref:uncharacterized protein LOC112000669 n=1 Tax=Quercus suber TaxID=58331 RepID=UPI000CE16E73|nr:uncharacterized protein LOC112000669 [Quercus suber]POE66039.1 putative calcium-transporting atpase 7, plasma membrane-type [Quercus suber]
MESYILNDFEVEPKHSSEEVLQRWRKLCEFVKNPKRRFRFTANLSKRYKAQAMRRTNQRKMNMPELRLQCLSLVLFVVLVPHLLSDARPLNPNMEGDRRERQHVANKRELPVGGPPAMYSPPSHIGNHEMSAAQKVHGGKYVPLDKGPVPPSAPNPRTHVPCCHLP